MKTTTTILTRLRLSAATVLLALPMAAQSLAGRIVDPNGVPIPGITIDPGNGSPTAISDALGMFNILGMSNRSYDVEYLPDRTAPWSALVRTTTVVGATNIGDVTLQPGHFVSGIVRFVGRVNRCSPRPGTIQVTPEISRRS